MVGNGGSSTTTDRRGFLKRIGTTSIAGGLAALLGERQLSGAVTATTADGELFDVDSTADPAGTFPQSVASGGPTPTGVILWTRVDPEAYVDGEPLGVQVATDTEFTDVVFEGSVATEDVGPGSDYTVNVDLDGELDPDRFYHYRFVYDGVASKTGRCRTLPAPDASPANLSFAVLTCQDYQNGYYNAYSHVAEEDVDFAIHLGDFIYESGDGAFTGNGVVEGRDIELPSGAPLAESLADFRHLYRTYRSDGNLQAAQEQHTFIYGWDDHEIGNDRYWDYAEDAPVLPTKANGDDPEFAMEVTANGIQAWVEHVPARVEYDPDAATLHEQLQLWRRYEFGDLLDLSVTDERMFRDGPPCEGGDIVTCGNEDDPDRTMLGAEQKQWFKEWAAGSDAKWTTWANEVLTMALTAGDGDSQVEFLHDSWDGFQAERYELMDFLADDADVRNFVTLTGDMHAALAGYMKEGYGEVGWELYRERVGVEFMTPAVTSVNAGSYIDFPDNWDKESLEAIATMENDHLAYVDWFSRGYSVIEFTRDDATFTVYGVDAKTRGGARKEELASYRTPDGYDWLSRV